MEITAFGEIYCTFRDAVTNAHVSLKAFLEAFRKELPPLARELHIGAVAVGLNAPASLFAPNGEDYVHTLFHNRETLPSMRDENAYAQSFSTQEGGLFTAMIYPEEGHEFDRAEEMFCKLLADDLFVMGGRARMMDMAVYAMSTELMTRTDNQATLMHKMGALKARGLLKDFTGIFINLKNFKYINKSMSSAIGDIALKTFASSIQQTLEEGEIISRLGGDNFYALLKKENVQKFIDKFSKLDITLNQGPTPLSFSIQSRMGVYSATPRDNVPEMMNYTSIALNIAKELKNTDLIYFSNEMQVQALYRREISSEFRAALQKREFVVHYQPKVNLKTKQLCGSEALVRWIRHKTIVPPMDFLPILEQEGSICQLDFYVFNEVCKDIRHWTETGIPPVRISVNFSKHHLKNPHFAEDILSTIAQHKVDSKYIEIELTEVSDYDDYMTMQRFITIMRQNGITVSIDDFGTGYSTLNVLKNFDVDVIKLDKSLLDNIGKENSMDEVVVKNVIHLANEMHKEVIAEGVENEVQAKFLAGVNCHNVQGYLFDKPLNRDEFQKRLTGEKEYI